MPSCPANSPVLALTESGSGELDPAPIRTPSGDLGLDEWLERDAHGRSACSPDVGCGSRYATADPDRQHLLMSVSKSMCGVIGPVRRARPAGPVCVRIGVRPGGLRALRLRRRADPPPARHDGGRRVQRPLPRPGLPRAGPGPGAEWRRSGRRPVNSYDFLVRLENERHPRRRWRYCSATTDALGWVLERVSAGGTRRSSLTSCGRTSGPSTTRW